MRQSANLDILRAFAVSAVLVDHLVPTIHMMTGFKDPIVLRFTANIGHAGVLAFFVHTSLVLMYSLERMHQAGRHVALRFYVRRFFRIYPLAISVIVFAVVLQVPTKAWTVPMIPSAAVVISNLLLVQNIFTRQDIVGPLWSLPYEVQMYVALPAVFLLARVKRGWLYVAGLLAGFYMLGYGLATSTGHLNMAGYVPCFLAGVLCYTLRGRVKAVIPAVWWTPTVVALIAGYCLVRMTGENTWLTTQPMIWWFYCLVLGLLIPLFKDSKSEAGNFVAHRVALYSYGMYLTHVPVLYFIFGYLNMQNLAVAIPLYVAMTLGVSMATFYCIEAPCIELGRRLSTPGYRKTREMEPVMPAP